LQQLDQAFQHVPRRHQRSEFLVLELEKGPAQEGADLASSRLQPKASFGGNGDHDGPPIISGSLPHHQVAGFELVDHLAHRRLANASVSANS